MKEKLKQLKALIRPPYLREDEKRDMKREFLEFQEMHPIRNRVVTRTPLFSFFNQFAYAYAVVGLVVASTFSVGAASEFSLPDDALYSFKTGVNERLLYATAYFSPSFRAEADTVVLARRLEEAERLMLERKFKAHTADELQHEINERTLALNAYIEESEASGRADRATETRTELAALLSEYDSILDIISLRKTAEDAGVVDSITEREIAKYLEGEIDNATTTELSAVADTIKEEYAQALLHDLVELDEELHRILNAEGIEAETILTNDLQTILAYANRERDQAEAALNENDPERALEHVVRALHAAQTVVQAIAELSVPTNS